jgi:hypothetical protein
LNLDSYFTPAAVSEQLISHATIVPDSVLDPAAGDGALLMAAENRWPQATCYGLDIDPRIVKSLRTRQHWQSGRCDFLSSPSRRSSIVLRSLVNKTDLVVMNPPYSIRGGTSWRACVAGDKASCGRAMAFVLTAMHYLREGGELLALLPSGSLTSRRDSEAWKLLTKMGSVQELESFPRGTFSLGTARTVAVRIRLGSPTSISNVALQKRSFPVLHANLWRGTFQVHTAKQWVESVGPGNIRFIHTTDLRNGSICQERARFLRNVPYKHFGPSVFLQRVGKPSLDKVTLWEGGAAVMSDCLYALETPNLESARLLHERLTIAWDSVRMAYGGSCAPYLTISELVAVLDAIGIHVSWTGSGCWIAPT